LGEGVKLTSRLKESENRPSEAAVGKAGSEVVLVVGPVDEAWFYTVETVISAVSRGQDLGEGNPERGY
jgi:hypothetical protein